MTYYIRNIKTATAVKRNHKYLFCNVNTKITIPLDEFFFKFWCFLSTPKSENEILEKFKKSHTEQEIQKKIDFGLKTKFFTICNNKNDFEKHLTFDKPEKILKLGNINIEPLQKLIKKIPEETWIKETKDRENNFFCFTETSHLLFLMHSDGQNHRKHFEKTIWKEWKSVLLPIMDEVVKFYGYKNGGYPKAMFAKLNAKGVIDKHTDGIGRNLKIHKIHIPIISNPDCKFIVGDEAFYLEPGGVYEVNNVSYHMVENGGNTDRTHFIFEYYNDDLW